MYGFAPDARAKRSSRCACSWRFWRLGAESVARRRVAVAPGGVHTVVRKRGLLVRFRSDTAATWTITATMRRAAKLRSERLQRSRGPLARTRFKAHTGSGTVRLRIPRARLAGMRWVVIRVQARVQAGGKSVQSSLLVRVGV